MSPTTLRILIGLVLIVHGIGHCMAFFPALNIFSTEHWHHRSWLLTPVIGETASRVLSVILFGAAMIGFVAAGLGLFGWLVPHDWWRSLSIVSAVISLVALALFWNSFVATSNSYNLAKNNGAVRVGDFLHLTRHNEPY